MYDISIEGINCYAYHGCLQEENRIGGNFSVDVHLNCDLSTAIESDELAQTIDYCFIHDVVREEMSITSKLIEHVAGRIAKRLLKEEERIAQVTVLVHKYNPPVNGFIGKASVRVSVQKD